MSTLDAAPTARRTRAGDPLRRRAGLPRASCTTGSTRAGSSCCRPASERGAPSAASWTRRARSARATGRSPPPRPDYEDRRVEITGPTDRKLVINALNSGAKGFMADFEDANSPTWANQVEGHVNLIDAIEGTITYDASEGKHYELDDEVATLLVRPRGWHLPEKHLQDRRRAGRRRARGLRPVRVPQRAAAARPAARRRTSTCPRWSTTSRRGCGTTSSASPRTRSGSRSGTIRATVLIETLPAAFQMDEILYELRDHSLRPQRRPLGLHLLDDQVLPGPARSSCCPTATT